MKKTFFVSTTIFLLTVLSLFTACGGKTKVKKGAGGQAIAGDANGELASGGSEDTSCTENISATLTREGGSTSITIGENIQWKVKLTACPGFSYYLVRGGQNPVPFETETSFIKSYSVEVASFREEAEILIKSKTTSFESTLRVASGLYMVVPVAAYACKGEFAPAEALGYMDANGNALAGTEPAKAVFATNFPGKFHSLQLLDPNGLAMPGANFSEGTVNSNRSLELLFVAPKAGTYEATAVFKPDASEKLVSCTARVIARYYKEPKCTLTSSSNPVAMGGSTVLSLKTEGEIASSDIDGVNFGIQKDPTLARVVTASKLFQASATDILGKKVFCDLQVNVIPKPTVSITANGVAGATTISYFGQATLAWQSTNADSCTVAPYGWAGVNRSVATPNLRAAQAFTVTCNNSSGSAAATVTVHIAAPTYCAILYKESDFGGSAFTMQQQDIEELDSGSTSSVKVHPGCSLTLWESDEYEDDTATYNSDAASLGGMDNNSGSAKCRCQ